MNGAAWGFARQIGGMSHPAHIGQTFRVFGEVLPKMGGGRILLLGVVPPGWRLEGN